MQFIYTVDIIISTLTDIYDGKQVIVSSRDIVEIIRSRTYNTK